MKKTPKTNTVTDEQGRVRFHGAFTGGFSAGYYNTVGSSEGFQPAQFVSSRTNRAAQPSNRSIADYMDEGDGLLGGKLSAQAGIDSFSVHAAGLQQLPAPPSDHSSVSSGLVGEQLINNMTMLQKSSDTVGKKLLATMGWRLGQGIGPRVTKKRVNYFDTNVNIIEMHPGADLSKLPKSSLFSKGVVTFAPDDEAQRVEYPPIKIDFYGIGFDIRNSGRLDATSHSGTRTSEYIDGSDEEDANIYRMGNVVKGGSIAAKDSNKRAMAPQYGQTNQKPKRLKYTSGFAYDDAEDDVYSNDAPLSLGSGATGSAAGQNKVVPFKYSHEVQEVSIYGDTASSEYLTQTAQKTAAFAERSKDTLQNINNSVDNWLTGGLGVAAAGEQETAGAGLSASVATVRCPSDNRLPLPGFHVARTPRVVPPYYPPPEVPTSFQCRHSFDAAPASDAAGVAGAGAGATTAIVNNGAMKATDAAEKGVAWSKRNQAPLDAAKARSAAMSEEIPISGATGGASETVKSSIFDLIKPEARAKLQSAINAVNPQSTVQLHITSMDKMQAPQPPPLPPQPVIPPPPPPPIEEKGPVLARPMLTSSHLLNSTFAGLSQAFKNRFASASTLEGAGAKDSIVVEGMATATEYNKKLAERQEETQRKESAHAAELAKSHPKVMKKGTVRVVTPWAPSPLLCKRFNVKLPDISRPSDLMTSSAGQLQNPITQLLGGTDSSAPPVVGFGRKGTGPDEIAAELERERREQEAVLQDVYQAPIENKPALSVFKSIFEDSDSDEDDEDGDDNDNSMADRPEAETTSEVGLTETGDSSTLRATSIPVNNISSSDATILTGPKSEVPTIMAADSTPAPADGPVQFVPSKQRTTVSRKLAGASTSFGAARKPAASHLRRSFIQEDDSDDDQGGRTAGSISSNAGFKASSTAGLAKDSADGEGTTADGMSSKLVTSGRQMSQSVARIGGVSVGGAGRKGRAAEGSLRQRLIAQRLAEEDSSEEAGTGETSGDPPPGPSRGALPSGAAEETGHSFRIGAERSKSTANQPIAAELSAANDAAVEEMLAFADNILLPTASIRQSALSLEHLPQGQLTDVPQVTQTFRVSRFGAPVPAVISANNDQFTVTGLVNPPPQPPLPPMPQQLPSPPAQHPAGPPAPPAVSINATSAAPSARPTDISKGADMRSSIQKLQGFLAPMEGVNAEKSGRDRKDRDRLEKKSHKSHKSSKHKHKKDPKSKHKTHKKKKVDKDKSHRGNSSSSSGSENDEGGSSSPGSES